MTAIGRAPMVRMSRTMPPTEELADALVLVVLEAELGERLGEVGVAARLVDRLVRRAHAVTNVLRTATNIARPSVPGPVRSSTACSGCGIRPTTLPASLR